MFISISVCVTVPVIGLREDGRAGRAAAVKGGWRWVTYI